jgi:NADH-quinone oxidoreductase subunit H
MSDVYVPWRPRQKQFSGFQQRVAEAAAVLYRTAKPILSRYPGVVFTACLILTCLATWIVALGFQTFWRVESLLASRGELAAGRAMTAEQLRAGLNELGSSAPAALIGPLRSLFVRDLIAVLGVVAFVSVLAMFAIWFERKVSGFLQSRLGPMRVGGWHGWSQSLADGLKLICKEDLIPDRADRVLFRLAPYVSFVPALTAFLALPLGTYWVVRNFDVGLLLVLAMLGVEVMGVLLAGWASNNKWSIYGSLREAAQVVSYEIPMGISLLVPVMVAGSLQLVGPGSVTDVQSGGWLHWTAWHSPWTFVAMFTYFIASLAACKRAPFDLPEAESELVAGYLTEYSGFRWALFFFAEYAAMFVVSGLLVLLFLGGWDAPWVGLLPAAWGSSEAPLAAQLLYGVVGGGPLWFTFKCLLLVYVQMWLRWTLPRLRIDQVLYSCVQVMLPLTMVVLLGSVVWEWGLLRSTWFAALASVIRYVLALVGVVGVAGVLYVALFGRIRRRELVGDMGVERPLPGG